MEISESCTKNDSKTIVKVAAFQRHKEILMRLNKRTGRFVVVEHRGFLCEDFTMDAAMGELMQMVRSRSAALYDALKDEDVKFRIGV